MRFNLLNEAFARQASRDYLITLQFTPEKAMRRFLPLLLSALFACSAQAEAVPYSFSFTGFFHEQTAQWLPDASLTGTFEGDDANGNGTYELGAQFRANSVTGFPARAAHKTPSKKARCHVFSHPLAYLSKHDQKIRIIAFK